MQTAEFKGRASNIRTENGVTKCRYHSTDVVEFDAERITLRSDGWQTATTKARMNQASNQFGLGFRVFQRDHEWFVGLPNGNIVPFIGGMIIPRHGPMRTA